MTLPHLPTWLRACPRPSARFMAWRAGQAVLCVALGVIAAILLSPRPPLLEGVPFSTSVLDRNGRLLRVSLAQDDTWRIRSDLAELPPQLVEATLLYEDRYFYWHPGVNPVAITRAALNEVLGWRGRFGASTITMQVARMRFGLNSRSLSGKMLQMLRAFQIERHYTKREILTAYLNLVPYGGNVEGAAAASRIYFRKAPAELTLSQCITLSVIPQSPAKRKPGSDSDGDLHRSRKLLAQRWLGSHPEDADTLRALDFSPPMAAPRDLPFVAPQFTQALLAEKDRERPSEEHIIHATLDAQLQRIVEQRITDSLRRAEGLGLKNAAALLVDWRTMEVRASAGSADFFNAEIQGQVDGTRMLRSPGSALKPFIYALAIDAGLIHPLSLLSDAPSSFVGYNPENFDRDFCGPILARDALTQSRNVPAVELEARLIRLRDEARDNRAAPSPCPRTLYEMLRAAEVPGLKSERHYGLAITLGAEEVSMRDIARLYGMLASGGTWRDLRDTTQAQAPARETPRRMLSPEACFLTLDMLATAAPPDALQTFAPRGAEDPKAVAWKTGTSFSFRDAWTAGVFDNFVLVVWVGNFDSTQNNALAGRVAAAPLFFSIAEGVRSSGIDKYVPSLHAETSRVPGTSHVPPITHDWHSPQNLNLTRVTLCATSGDIACPHCPRTVQSWFIPGRSPISICAVHQLVWIDPATGLRVTAADSIPGGAKEQVVEVWPSDIQKLFARASMSRRGPPPWAPGHEPRTGESTSSAPAVAIVSPQPGLQYRMIAGEAPPRIPLQAASSGRSRRVDWFRGTEPLGSSRPDEVLLWSAPPGRHELTAVTDDGAVASVNVTVSVTSP
ncbi:penicillin-binding protein 1C [Verrucomicrobia bacterium LW23]|nr:penicillin-binding protein 1C [Verrucomicrobia bacterium LW23]